MTDLEYPHGPAPFEQAKPGDRVLLVDVDDPRMEFYVEVAAVEEFGNWIKSSHNTFDSADFDLFLQAPPLPPKPTEGWWVHDSLRRAVFWLEISDDEWHSEKGWTQLFTLSEARPLVAAQIADKLDSMYPFVASIVRAMFPVEGQNGAGS